MTTTQEQAILDVYPTEEERDNDPVTYTYMVADPSDITARIQSGEYIASK